MNHRASLFGIEIDSVRVDEAVSRLMDWVQRADGLCRFVVTPNVDHIVMLEYHRQLRAAYSDAAMVLADGMPLVVASRLLGCALPERVAGSDLVPKLLSAASPERPLKLYLLGAAPHVAERAADKIERIWPAVRVVGRDSPPFGFERDEAANREILARIAKAAPDVLLIGLGAPKQELWVHKHHRNIKASVALCAGATIDFLAGDKTRAPRWMCRSGLEWFYRLALEPRRLFRRYAHDAWVFPRLVFRAWRTRSSRIVIAGNSTTSPMAKSGKSIESNSRENR